MRGESPEVMYVYNSEVKKVAVPPRFSSHIRRATDGKQILQLTLPQEDLVTSCTLALGLSVGRNNKSNIILHLQQASEIRDNYDINTRCR